MCHLIIYHLNKCSISFKILQIGLPVYSIRHCIPILTLLYSFLVTCAAVFGFRQEAETCSEFWLSMHWTYCTLYFNIMCKTTPVKQIRITKPAERPRKQKSKYQMAGKCYIKSFEAIMETIPSGGEYGTLLLYLPFLSHINTEFLNNHSWA